MNNQDDKALRNLSAAIEEAEMRDPLPRCIHGGCLRDGGGELLEPPCGCRFNQDDKASLEFSQNELRELIGNPSVIAFLIDYHAQQATMAEAMGFDCAFHDRRIVELEAALVSARGRRRAQGYEDE